MPDPRRILDANANRAREAARVMEEAARFLLDDTALSRSAKRLRHELAAALEKLPAVELHRDTGGDVGTSIGERSEQQRRSAAEVVIAAGKRFSEALRCLEEYTKLTDAALAGRFEKLRYRGYELEAALHQRLGAAAPRQWRLCLVLSEALCERMPWLDVARAALDGGADCIQLREKHLADRELLDRAERLAELVRTTAPPRKRDPRPSLIVNDRPDVAQLAGADGVHLGETDLPPTGVRKLVGRAMLIGASTHNLTEARRAVNAGVDYCGVGTIFPTQTKRRKTSGLTYLQKFLERYPDTPHLAIGGITDQNVDQVVETGAKGVAVSSFICGARRPDTAARKLLRRINRAT